MAMRLKRPILVGGLGLTAGACLWNTVAPSVSDIGGIAVWGAIAIGSGLWWLKHRSSPTPTLDRSPTPISREAVEQSLSEVETRITQLIQEADAAGWNSQRTETLTQPLRQSITQIRSGMERDEVYLAIAGGKSVGKTTLCQWLNQVREGGLEQADSESDAASRSSTSHGNKTVWDAVHISDTEALFAQPWLHTGTATEHSLPEPLCNADLILFVTAGDLTDSEYQAIAQWVAQKHRLLLVLNQHDRYLPHERDQLVQHLQARLAGLMSPSDLVTVAIAPAPIKVRLMLPDGTVEESLEQGAPEGEALTTRLTALLTQEKQSLILATAMRQSLALQRQVQQHLNALRRDRAMPMIEEYQWIAAAAAFANPVPSLDLLATAAINAQLVVDIGKLYHLNFSVEQAKTVAGTLAEMMVKLGLVELASQALGPLLKGHLLTFAAGGVIQGLSAAYLTRIAGLSLVEFFEQHALVDASAPSAAQLPLGPLMQTLQSVFQQNQRLDFLKSLVQGGLTRLLPASSEGDVRRSVAGVS